MGAHPKAFEPDLSTLPAVVDRRGGADIVTRYFFPVSPRTLERWPLAGRRVNGKLVFATADLIAHARAVLAAAPAIRGGHSHGSPSQQAA